ncbi:HNH endonuclease [Endozoicomonas elysicola]|uniref:HNH domain-containing protein n=1 Tax=Endozoicomonas elysicola TaxID=305900 RepID=A0A081K843_9GAMM|nr:HNH endonuclease [Endozoicomonas elysicola]KEI70319.1 hypothetical protein GV64_05855 [Endozoicomonas elysicola]
MSSRILEAYQLTASEKKIIDTHFSTHKDWEKSVFEGIKENLVNDLRIKQNNKCCYCRNELGYDIKAVDIEHILPKSKYEKFTFHTKNLALSCPGCNTSKGSKEVLKSPIKKYPRTGTNIIIVHAHFDNYESSIEIHSGSIYEGLDEKGCETIKQCKLYRLKRVHKKARKNLSNSSPIQQLVESLRTASDADKQLFINQMREMTNQFQGP